MATLTTLHTHATYIHIQALVVHFLYTVLSNRKLQLNFAIIMHHILVTFKRLEFLEKSIQIISVRIPMESNLISFSITTFLAEPLICCCKSFLLTFRLSSLLTSLFSFSSSLC